MKKILYLVSLLQICYSASCAYDYIPCRTLIYLSVGYLSIHIDIFVAWKWLKDILAVPQCFSNLIVITWFMILMPWQLAEYGQIWMNSHLWTKAILHYIYDDRIEHINLRVRVNCTLGPYSLQHLCTQVWLYSMALQY